MTEWYCLLYIILIFKRSIYFKGRVTEKPPSADSLPKDHNSQDWVRLKPGARDSVQVSRVGGRALSADFLGTFAEGWSGMEQLGFELGL